MNGLVLITTDASHRGRSRIESQFLVNHREAHSSSRWLRRSIPT